jgi:hypothetical protein
MLGPCALNRLDRRGLVRAGVVAVTRRRRFGDLQFVDDVAAEHHLQRETWRQERHEGPDRERHDIEGEAVAEVVVAPRYWSTERHPAGHAGPAVAVGPLATP